MSALQAKAAIVLFETRLFDRADIAQLLSVPEAEVCRVLAACRDITREMYRDKITAANAP